MGFDLRKGLFNHSYCCRKVCLPWLVICLSSIFSVMNFGLMKSVLVCNFVQNLLVIACILLF